MVTITHQDVQEFLRKVTTEQPDRVNPFDFGAETCLYNGPDGDHCIAGEYLAMKGLTVNPEWEGMGIREVLVDLWKAGELDGTDDGAKALLTVAQDLADRNNGTPWGEVGEILREQGLI